MPLSNTATIQTAAPPRAHPVSGWLRARSSLGVSFGAFVLLVMVGGSHGGFFPTSWNWTALALAWVAGLAFIFNDRAALGRLQLAFLTSLLLFVGWMALSITWSSDVEASVLEVQRALVYVLAVVVALLTVRSRSMTHLLGGLLAGATWLSAQGLATRLFPDTVPGTDMILQDRLAGPIGYANAFGLLAVMGALLALGFAMHATRLPGRAAAAAAAPILLTAAYFTFSRGTAVALCVGLLAAIALDGRRLAILTKGAVIALPAAAAVWLASRTAALTSSTAAHSAITDEGGRFAIVVLALMITSAAIALVIATVEPRVRIRQGVRRAYAVALSCAALVLVGGLVMGQGGPGPLVDKAYHSINRDLQPTEGGDPNNLNRRLGSIGSTARVNYWEVGWRQYEQHPVLGAGAGTYEQFWLRYRPINERAVDGHSLYLETLAQLGWPGLALLLAMLLVPLAGAVRTRSHPLVAGAAGAYVAYLLHTGVDWDWELPVVTLLALLCGIALMATREDTSLAGRALSPRVRAVGFAGAVAAAMFALIGLTGNRALDDATNSVATADYRTARQQARTAVRWAPWSAEAERRLATAQVGLDQEQEARVRLRRAAAEHPQEWRIWYDLGTVSSGREQRQAFMRAARLNPLDELVVAARKRGYRPPPTRKLE